MKKQILKSLKLHSGGQTGADRAALDFALKRKLPCGGWCPAGRMAEDGTIPKHYPLRETHGEDPKERTHRNVKDGDATLIIYYKKLDEGSRYTLSCAKEELKPVYIIHSGEEINIAEFILWMEINKVRSLNIAGPKESNDAGVYDYTIKALESIFL